jgi:hypothetical protein
MGGMKRDKGKLKLKWLKETKGTKLQQESVREDFVYTVGGNKK